MKWTREAGNGALFLVLGALLPTACGTDPLSGAAEGGDFASDPADGAGDGDRVAETGVSTDGDATPSVELDGATVGEWGEIDPGDTSLTDAPDTLLVACPEAVVTCSPGTPGQTDLRVGSTVICVLTDLADVPLTPSHDAPFEWTFEIADEISSREWTAEASYAARLAFAGETEVTASWTSASHDCRANPGTMRVLPTDGLFAQVLWHAGRALDPGDLDLHLLRAGGCYRSPLEDMSPAVGSGSLDWGVPGEVADNPFRGMDARTAPGGEVVWIESPSPDESFALAVQGSNIRAVDDLRVRSMVWLGGELRVDRYDTVLTGEWFVVADVFPADASVVGSEVVYSDTPDCE